MKALSEDVKTGLMSSIKISGADCARLDVAFHRHAHFELSLIIKGSGSRIAGADFSRFRAGDVALYGADLPHSYVSSKSSKCAKTLVIQFARPCFGAQPAPELEKVDALLNSAEGGLKFSEKYFPKVLKIAEGMRERGPFGRYLALLEILNLLAEDRGRAGLSAAYSGAFGKDERMVSAKAFLSENFSSAIAMGDAARVAGLSEGAFRRLFKETYALSPKKYLLNLRLAEACRSLAHTRKTVLEIAFDCGFSNISNFNRRFKDAFKMSAREYRKLNFI